MTVLIICHGFALWICHKLGGLGWSFSEYLLVICVFFFTFLFTLHLWKGFSCAFLVLNWNQGFLGHPCLVRASNCLHRSCLHFGLNALTVVFKTTSRSTFPYWESQKLQVPGLSDSKRISIEGTHGHVRTQQWKRQWVWVDHSALHLAALDLWLLHSSCRGPQDPADFWKCHLQGPLWRAEMQLCILIHRKSAGFSFLVTWRLVSFFSQKFSRTRNLELSWVYGYDVSPEVYWWKRQGRQQSISITEHLELLMIEISSAFWWESLKRF